MPPIIISELTPDDLVQAFSKVSNVLGIQASHRYSSVRGEVDVSLIDQSLALFRINTSEAEHANLINDVVPITGSLEFLGQ